MKSEKVSRAYLLPFILTGAIIIVDQVTKAIIATRLELYRIGFQLGGDFLRIIHVRNHGIAFSMGNDFPEALRTALFIAIPAVVVIAVLIYYFVSNEIDAFMRWALAT